MPMPNGKVYFFVGWSDPDATLPKYLDERDNLQAGRQPRRLSNSLSLGDLVKLYLEEQFIGSARFEVGAEADYGFGVFA
jgi:hypothetical protein